MYELQLVVADEDGRYVDVVTQYITVEHPSQIQVVSFTQPELLVEYLSSGQGRVDVLLAQPEFARALHESQVALPFVVLLDEGEPKLEGAFLEQLSDGEGQWPKVSKYQSGDQLVHSILELHSRHSGAVPRMVAGDATSRVVSVYAPAGGVGKTSIALALASKLSDMGKTVFYLNLEVIDSFGGTKVPCDDNAMSQVLLTLLETPDLLQFKLEACKTTDSYYGFDYLTPPDCFRELSEISSEHWQTLLHTLRAWGKYDFIVVDLNSAGDGRTNQLLDLSDQLLLVQTPEPLCRYKLDTFLRQIQSLSGVELLSKTTLLLNKYAGEPVAQELPGGLPLQFRLPMVPELWVLENQHLRFDPQRILRESLIPLVETLL